MDIWSHVRALEEHLRPCSRAAQDAVGLAAIVAMYERLEQHGERFDYAQPSLVLLASASPTASQCAAEEQRILEHFGDVANEDDTALLQLLAWFRLRRLDDLVVTLERCVGAHSSIDETFGDDEKQRQMAQAAWARAASDAEAEEALRHARHRAKALAGRE